MPCGQALALFVGVVFLASIASSEVTVAELSASDRSLPDVEGQRSDEGGRPAGDTLSRIYARCGDSLGCSLWELANVVNGISARDSLDLFSGLFRVEKKMRSTEQPEAEEEAAEVKDQDVKVISIDMGAETLASSVERFLKTHVVHLAVSDGAETEGRASEEDLTYDLANLVPEEEGRRIGRGKLRRFLIPLLIGFKLKAGVLFPLFFSAVAIIALKALGAGLSALLLASVLGLKAIVDGSKGGGSGSKISVEVVKPHPVSIEHQYHHGHHHAHPIDSHWGWGRDGDDQAYKGYYYGESRI